MSTAEQQWFMDWLKQQWERARAHLNHHARTITGKLTLPNQP